MRHHILGSAALLALLPAAATAIDVTCEDSAPRLCLAPDADATAAVVILTVPAGAADEEAGAYGVAHYLEHLAFRDRAAEAGDLDRYGNAYTSHWATTYHWAVPPERAAQAVARALAVLTPPDLPEATAEAERVVVAREREERADGADAAEGRAVDAALLAGTPLARPVIGEKADVDALTLEAALAFHARHYRPQGATLLIAGAIDADALRRAANAVPDGFETPRRPALAPGAPTDARLNLALDVPAPRRSRDAMARLDADVDGFAALTVLGAFLDSSLPGAPYPTLARARDDLHDASAQVYEIAPGWAGLGVTLAVPPGAEADTLDAPWAAWDALWDGLARDGLDADTVARLAKRLARDEDRSRRDGIDAAWSLTPWLEAGYAPAEWAAYPGALAAVTPEAVARVAAALGEPLRAVTTTTTPTPASTD